MHVRLSSRLEGGFLPRLTPTHIFQLFVREESIRAILGDLTV